MRFSRAQRAAAILPSVPRAPKPPGTTTPETVRKRAGQLVGRDRLRVDPDDLRLDLVPEAGMGQRLEHAHVGVGQLDVLADDGDPHRPPRPADLLDEIPPLAQIGFARQSELARDVGAEPGLFQDERHLVDGVGGRHGDDGVAIDVAEECDLLFDVVGNRAVGASDDDVGLDAERAQLAHALLGRFRLQLAAADLGNQGDVDVERVLAADLAAELADRLDERLPLDVADRAADLDDDDVGVVLAGGEPMRSLISLVMCGMTWIVPPR